MRLFKKNDTQSNTKLPMTGRVKEKEFPLLLYGGDGDDRCAW